MSVDITEYFNKLLVSERDSDFTIVAFDEEGNKVERKAHKIILKRSPYFEGLFNVEGKEQQAGTVTLDNIPNETMTLVLNYLYTDDLDIPTKDAADVSIAADYLQLELLRDECIRNLSQNYTELTADELAASLDKVLKHKLMEPDNCEDMIEYLVCNLNHWNNLPYLSEEFLTVLIEQDSYLPRQCLYWLENWTDIEHEKEQRLEKAKNLLSKLDLLQLSARDLLECSSSPLLSSSLVLELLKKKAKEDDGDAREYTFGFYGDYTKEFEYQGTHWIVAFYAFSVKDYTELEDKKLFEFIKGDPDANIDVTLKSPKQKGFTWNLKPLEREGYLQATPAGFQAIEAMKQEKYFILEFTVSL